MVLNEKQLREFSLIQKIPSTVISHEIALRALLFLLISSVIFVLAGGLYNINEKPPLIGPLHPLIDPPPRIFHPSLDEQFVLESVSAAIFISFGMVGFLRINLASKYAYDSSRSMSNLIIGICIVFFASISLVQLFEFKVNIHLSV